MEQVIVIVGLIRESLVVQEYILQFPTAFWFWRDANRVSLKKRLRSRAEAGCSEAWLSMRRTINIEKLVSNLVHVKGPVSPMGPMIHEFDEDTG